MAIRTALIGFGIGGRFFHEPFLGTNSAYAIDAVVTSSPERRAEAARRYRVLGSTEEVWARAEEFDLAVVTSPTALHTEHALAALDAGLHVVVDKPITTSSAEARQVIEYAEKAERSLSTFQSRRWDAEIRTARTLIDEGALGEITGLDLAFQRDVGALRPTWRDANTATAGGGVTFDLGSHLLDQAQYLLGPGRSVTGSVRRVRGGMADDEMEARLVHESGVVSRILCSWVAPRTRPRLRITGSEAAYTVGDTDPQEAALKRGERPRGDDFGRVPESEWGQLTAADGSSAPVPTRNGDYAAFYREFARHLRDGGPVPVNPRDAVRTLEFLEVLLAGESAQ